MKHNALARGTNPPPQSRKGKPVADFVGRRRDVLRAIADCTASPKGLRDVFAGRPLTMFEGTAVEWLEAQGYLRRGPHPAGLLAGLEVTDAGREWLERGGPTPAPPAGAGTGGNGAEIRSAGGGERIVKKVGGMS